MRFFRGGHFEFFKSAILNFFFCFISEKNPANFHEVSFFSALWMVFPESWKRRAADFYAHHCRRRAVISPLNIELFKACEKLPFALHFTVCKFSSFCLTKKDQK